MSMFENKESTIFFDEGPKIIKRSVGKNSSSIETVNIDGYRQGVEITQQKHFDAGLIKIHAGEQSHKLKQNKIGLNHTSIFSEGYVDIARFDPKTFIESSDDGLIVIDDNNHVTSDNFDGVLEPLTIRKEISFSGESPFIFHSIKCIMMNGNEDLMSSEFVLTEDYVDTQRQINFNDHVSDIKKSTLTPFVDKRYVQNIKISYDSELTNYMSSMTGSTENLTLNKKISQTGFHYSDTPYGIDSISFGGMTYR